METNAILETILHRRSIRRYKPDQIPEAALNAILQAGLYAPSAGGRQGVLFDVSQDAETNDRLGRIKKANSRVRPSTETAYISREQPSIADDPSIQSAFYGAPTVVTLFGPKQFLYAINDCSVAAENMMLAADSLGIGSCYIGSAWDSFDDPYGQEVLRRWAVRADYFAVLHVLLGNPLSEKHPTAKPRREGRILRV